MHSEGIHLCGTAGKCSISLISGAWCRKLRASLINENSIILKNSIRQLKWLGKLGFEFGGSFSEYNSKHIWVLARISYF